MFPARLLPVTNKRDGRTIEQVGDAVKDRRMALQMDQAGLARLAEVDAKTVRSLERGERWPRDVSRAKIEVALQWEPGSLDDLLAGGEVRSIDGLAGFTDSGEELFELPGARVYETLHYPDGRAYPIPSDLLDRADEARAYLREHPDVDPQLRDLLQAIIAQADLTTLQDRIRQLTRPQRLKLSKFVDQLLTRGASNVESAASSPAQESGAPGEASEDQKTLRGRAHDFGTRARNVSRPDVAHSTPSVDVEVPQDSQADNDPALNTTNQPADLDHHRNENRRNKQAAAADIQWPAPDSVELEIGPDAHAARTGETAEQKRLRLTPQPEDDPQGEGPEGGA